MEFENNKGGVSCILCRGINGTRMLNGTKMVLMVSINKYSLMMKMVNKFDQKENKLK